MAIKTNKPTSAGRRFATHASFEELSKVAPEKSLLVSKNRTGGRNAQGKITVRHIGGGGRQKYRIIDFKRNKDGVPAKVTSIEYDPNRTAYIALLTYADGEKRYILAPLGLTVGDVVMSGENAEIKVGNNLPLANIPVGSVVHNIELSPKKGGQVVRSAGAAAQLMAKEGKYVMLRMPSGEMRNVLATCRATIGTVGNLDHEFFKKQNRSQNKIKTDSNLVRAMGYLKPYIVKDLNRKPEEMVQETIRESGNCAENQ